MTEPNMVLAQGARSYLSHVSRLLWYLALACCLSLEISASGQTGDENEKHCADPTENSALRIAACTALIESGQKSTDYYLAIAYNNRGNGYKDNGEYDRAIQDFGQAIQLRPDYSLAFYNRGNAYDSKGEYDRAIQSFNQVIRLQPHDASAYYAFYARGYAYNAKGDYDRAVQDFDQAILLKPDDANAFSVRGVANFLRANLAGAAADFQRGSELDPTIGYDVLWLHLARKRLGLDDKKDLTKRSAKADPAQWPTPILKLFTGQMTAVQVMAVAASFDANKHTRQLCEANFFAGEDALLHQRGASAKALFQAALDGCPKTNLHYDAAAAELRRLNATTAPTGAATPAK